MIIKRAFEYEVPSQTGIPLSMPGSSSTVTHYPLLAQAFWNGFIQALNELGVTGEYNAETGLGTIGGIPIMMIHRCGTIYMACDGVTGGATYSTVSLSYTGKSSTTWQAIGVTIKGTSESFSIYLGSGDSVGDENLWFSHIGMRRLSDNKLLYGFNPNSTSWVLTTYEDLSLVELNKVCYPSSEYANTGTVYSGYALVQAVTTSMAYLLENCYMGCSMVADASYYNIAGVNVVVVGRNLLLEC